MPGSMTKEQTKTTPKTIYLKDYQIPTYWIDQVNLTFDLQEEHTMVTSEMLIRRNRHVSNDSRDVILNGVDLTLSSISMNGKPLPETRYTLQKALLIIHDVPDECKLEIQVTIFPSKNTALSGLYRSGGTYCTQCEAEGFRRITYYMDHPDILSQFTTKIIADEKRYPMLLSNGNLIESGKSEGGRHWVKWQDPFKKPSYLFALVAGDFDLLEDTFTTQSGSQVALRIYTDRGFGNQSPYAMQCLKDAMSWDEKTFGREYDLDNYMIVAIGDFNMGAMENKGLNIFNTKYVLAKPDTATDDDYIHILSVIGHEYFHNWSGNRVTCRDWFQLSLKEGLTIFRDQLFTEDLISKAVMRIRDVNRLREVQFAEDAGPLSHPVRPDSYLEINNFYTATVYEKGAEVLRMLRTTLGVDVFRRGMDLYFARHDGQAVTIEDFVRAMEDVSGKDLSQFRLWYSQSGTPMVNAYGEYDEENRRYSLTLRQCTLPTPGQREKHPLDIPIKMGMINEKGKSLKVKLEDEKPADEVVLNLDQESKTYHFIDVPSLPIPSLLRDFSAPVKINYPYSVSDLVCLFEHDVDPFNRCEAGRLAALSFLMELVNQIETKKPLTLTTTLSEMYQYVLSHQTDDTLLVAELLKLPSEKYIGEQMEVVLVDSIHHAREHVLGELAVKLEKSFLKQYQLHQTKSDKVTFDIKAIGSRTLKNTCLSYLMRLPKHLELGYQQFKTNLTSNMTDTQAALTYLVNTESTVAIQALADFYEVWKGDPLVVDKWFAIQAASKSKHTLKVVKELVKHPAFDIKNPNKVYALIGTFGYHNPINFHAINGDGYVFLREMVEELDPLNPQVAGRMVNPLTSWKRYDKERQGLMQKQLETLLYNKNLSTDVYELVSKSLE